VGENPYTGQTEKDWQRLHETGKTETVPVTDRNDRGGNRVFEKRFPYGARNYLGVETGTQIYLFFGVFPHIK